jgi:hypothetical protein
VLVVCVLLVGVAGAQEAEPPKPYIYSTYYECPTDDQWLADEIVKAVMAPAWDAAVEGGTVTAWGWLAHHTGGTWRRAFYYVAPTLDALLDAAGTVNGKIDAESPLAANKLSQLCPSHDDYIWRVVAGSPPASDRGEASFSVYMVCDPAREGRADEIVEQVVAPIYDRQVASGALKTWGWHEHMVGGIYRRLATASAADHKSLLEARDAFFTELFEQHREAGEELDSICGSHQDYMWDIQMETP